MPQQTEDFVCPYCADAGRLVRLLELELYLDHLDLAHDGRTPAPLQELFDRDAALLERWRRHRHRHARRPARLRVAWGKPQPLTRTS